MSASIFIYLLAGLALVTLGAECLVRGASRLARRCAISSLVMGLTVVAFGVSAPELAVSVQAVWLGVGDIAIGNVLGSTIFNILGIMGCAALIMPLMASRVLVTRDVPVMIGASVLAFALAWDQQLSRLDGAILLGAGMLYIACLIYFAPRASYTDKPHTTPTKSTTRNLVLIVLGVVLLVVGAHGLVIGATELARALGLSDLVIGLTVVAVGTALPELITALAAIVKGEREIAVGTIIGSNIFNLLAVLGVASLISPTVISVSPNVLDLNFPVVLAIALACLPVFYTGCKISRIEGAIFLTYYAAYVAYLVLFSTGRPQAQALGDAVLYYAIPLTLMGILLMAIRAFKRA